MQAKLEVKTVILIDGQAFVSSGEGENIFECAEVSRQGAIEKWVKAKFKEVRSDCSSDHEAILAVSAELSIGERTVQRYVKGY